MIESVIRATFFVLELEPTAGLCGTWEGWGEEELYYFRSPTLQDKNWYHVQPSHMSNKK